MHEGPWRVAHDLVWTRYADSDDWAVFNPRSGDVHLVTASAHFLWQSIADRRGVTSAELLVGLAAHIRMPLDEGLSSVAGDTMAFMDRAGLIVPDIQ